MKKKFKKLSLTTETLRNLNEPSLKNVAGGTEAETNCTCTINCTQCTGHCSVCTAICSACGIGCSAPCG